MQIYIYNFSLNFHFWKFLDVSQSWEVKNPKSIIIFS